MAQVMAVNPPKAPRRGGKSYRLHGMVASKERIKVVM